jgi:hypothetical protein
MVTSEHHDGAGLLHRRANSFTPSLDIKMQSLKEALASQREARFLTAARITGWLPLDPLVNSEVPERASLDSTGLTLPADAIN